MAVRCPASEHDAEDAHSAHADHKKNSDVDVLCDLESGPNRQTGHRQQSGSHRKHWREPENELVRVVGDDVFLDEQLHRVSNGL